MFVLLLIVVAAIGVYALFRDHIAEDDPIKVWEGKYEMRGRERVKVGWGKP
jgi:hypothetical protein